MNVQFINTDGVKIFESAVPHKSVLFDYLKGNTDLEHVLYWNTNNKAHATDGTTIKGTKMPSKAVGHCRYYFGLKSEAILMSLCAFCFTKIWGS